MKKTIKLLAAAILIALSFSSCKKDEPAVSHFLKADKSEIILTADGSSDVFNIESNVDWEIDNSASWLTVSPASGNGNAKISVSAGKATEDRSATIQINATKVNLTPVKVTVKQSAPVGKSIKVSPETLDFKADGSETKTVKVECDGAWTTSNYPENVTVTPANGSGNTDVSISLKKNPSSSKIECSVTFGSGSAIAKVNITQQGFDIHGDIPGGAGTAEYPFTIDNAKQWMAVITDWKDTKGATYAREANYKVINDIDFAGVQLFTPDTLRGSFDGQNHKLYNITISGSDATTGFFGVVTASSFKDVIFGSKDGKNYDGVSKISYTGGASGWYYISTVARLECDAENIKSFINIEVGSESLSKVRVAGLFARVLGENRSIKNCINYGDVTCLNSGKAANQECLVGGVVATFEDSGKGNVENCENYGKVKSADPYTTALGGVVGNCPKNKFIVMKGCKNYGEVDINTSKTPTDYKEGYVGGIAGLLNADAAATGNNELNQCTNYANITVTGITVGNLGGIAGRIPGCKYTKCVNEGNITFDGNVAGKALLIGGIAGGVYANGTFEECVNKGNVSSNKNQVNRLGGIIGTVNTGNVVVKNCTNSGACTISRSEANANWQACGGIIGFQEKSDSFTLDGCTNTGKVSVAMENNTTHANGVTAGGIVGLGFLNVDMKNNVNKGDVAVNVTGTTTIAYAGGVAGKFNAASVKSTGDKSKCAVTLSAPSAGASAAGAALGFNAGAVANPAIAGSVNGTAVSSDNMATIAVGEGTAATGVKLYTE